MDFLGRQLVSLRRLPGVIAPEVRHAPVATWGIWLILLSSLLLGCNSNTNPGTTPWGYSGAQNPSNGIFGRPTFLSDMNQRAAQQQQLASEQQQRLNQLMQMYQQNEQQLAALRAEQAQLKQGATERDKQQQELLAQRAREALGRYDELDRRAAGLDLNNQDLQTRLAQLYQRTKLLEDQNHLLRQRLSETSQQLASTLDTQRASEERLQTMMASTRRKSGASISANNSYRRNLTAVSVEGLSIRQDGELVRIELPADLLFERGTARLLPGATAIIDQVATVILDNYSRQVIGVEAHTDNADLTGTMWRNAHQMTAAQAMAVFEHLSYRHPLMPKQMFVLGHGQNYPLASNATPAGQQRNRRVEVVVYPEVVGQR